MSWADPRIDLFGIAPDSSFWHKFYTGWDWQPAQGFERISAEEASCPSVTTWGEGRLDLVYVNASGSNVLHKYYGGGNWVGSEDLGGDVESVSSYSWGDNRLDIVAKNDDGSYVHKAWTGTEWYPSIGEWEDFGGELASQPALGSWGPGRLDLVGISSDSGSIHHKYWHEGWSKWEDLGGGPFVGTPKVTSWGPNRLDIWAVGKDGQLNHLAWDGTQYLKWEKLGGEFKDTPDVAHWDVSKIDIVGKIGDRYQLKNYDGSQWNPSSEGWYNLASSYDSEPSVVARRETSKFALFHYPNTSNVTHVFKTSFRCSALPRIILSDSSSGVATAGNRPVTLPGRWETCLR